jgi:hypothetical protein
METIQVKVEGGCLVATVSYDENYPGIDIEFVADDDKGEQLSRPRILFEKPVDGELRVLVWEDPNNEDYTKEITF